MASLLDQSMLQILALSPRASVCFSTYTRQWYVAAPELDLTDGTMLHSVAPHRDTPSEAVLALIGELQAEQDDKVIACNVGGQRRHYRWNGAAFAEVPDHLLPWRLGAGVA